MEPKIIGVLHIDAFPKKYNKKAIDKIKAKALNDLACLQFGGVDAVIIENEFYTKKSPYGEFLTQEQQDIMFEIAEYIKKYLFVPFGFCVLLNDYKTALLLAKKFGGEFIRLDTFVDNVERISDKVKIFPNPEAITDFRNRINAKNIEIWTDIHVKHTKLLEKKSLVDSAKLALDMGSNRLIITGNWTGNPPRIEDILKIKKILPAAPLAVGSGVDKDNIAKYRKYVDKIIIGSAFKKNGSVSVSKVREITAKNKNISNSKRIALISSFSFDHISDGSKNFISPGGPAYFISKVFNQKNLAYDLFTSSITHVREKIVSSESVGSEISVPKPITFIDEHYKNILISTQLQEFDLKNIVAVKADIYLDLQGYVSMPWFSAMKKLSLKREIWEKLTYIKCNAREYGFLPENFINYAKNEKVFIITKGAEGIDFYIKGKKHSVKTEKVKVDNALGAGDTFFANFVFYNIYLNDVKKAIIKSAKDTVAFLK